MSQVRQVAGTGATDGFATSMSASDSVMWTIERDPELRSTVVVVSMLDRAPDRRRLRSRVEQAIRDIARLHQVVLPGGPRDLTPRWVDAEEVNLDYHFRTVAAPEPPDRRWLLEFAAVTAESGFDKTRPLWEIVVVEGLEGEAAALVLKVHHSVTDGVGGMQLMTTLLESSRGSRAHPLSHFEPHHGNSQAPGRPFPARIAAAAGGIAIDGARLGNIVLETVKTTASVARLVAPGGRRQSPVLTGHSTDWRFDVCERPLDQLRRAGTAANATVNDVFLAALAGGLHRYHLCHGHDVEALRLTLPVSLRRPTDPLGGNRFVPVRFSLPIAEPDPLKRVQEVRAVSKRWRSEPALPLTEAVAGVLNILPAPVTTAVMQSLLKGVDIVATNVTGIPSTCYIAGSEVTRQFAFAPLSGAAINAALVSHAGVACIGVNTDRRAVEDPDLLMSCLSDGLDEVIGIGSDPSHARSDGSTERRQS